MLDIYSEKSDDFQKHIVRKFEDYLQIVKKIKSENSLVWFRGQSDASYRLLPNAMRCMIEYKDQAFRDIPPKRVNHFNNRGNLVRFISVTNMLEEFKKKAEPYLRIKPQNDFEWSFIAQHYGIPTKLLDWTTDPLVALFFSMPKDISLKKKTPIKDAIKNFEGDSFCDLGVAVFAFNPCRINSIFKEVITDTFKPIDAVSNYELLKGYIYPSKSSNFIFPLCITSSTTIDKRICRQSGNFTIHGEMIWPIDFRSVVQKEIHKIFIPYCCIDEIQEWLLSLDITETSIYGSSHLDLISTEISQRENEKFLKLINDMVEKYKKEFG